MLNKPEHLQVIQSPKRTILGAVAHYKGATLYKRYSHNDYLKSVSVDRNGTHKFFGVGICHTAEITLIDTNREIEVEKGDIFLVLFGRNENSFVHNFPYFYATGDVVRDENTNEIKIKVWDKIAYKATEITVGELSITFPATIADYATQAANALKLAGVSYPTENTQFNLSYAETANYAGTETLRDLLDDIAEATQTIYYIGSDNNLIFKQLNAVEPALTIGKADYFTLTSKDAVVLANIGHTTELGDNITSSSGMDGATQYIRNNGFLELRTDTATILDNAVAAMAGTAINPITCEWRGNYLLEIGDYIALTTKDDDVVYCYLLDEKIKYTGGFSSTINWGYAGDEETASNPSNLGEMLNQTFARVDKAAKRAEIVVSEVSKNTQSIASLEKTTDTLVGAIDDTQEQMNQVKEQVDDANENVNNMREEVQVNTERIASLTLTTNEITMSVSQTQQQVNTVSGEVETNSQNIASLELTTGGISANVAELDAAVSAAMTSEDVKIEIKRELAENGIDKVITATGFVFDDSGLTVSKSGTEMTTLITEDGMTVNKNGSEMLKADNTGVVAKNLNATTYLIVGNKSRFENYGSNRTGCFWIGG